ncbi:MAG: ribose ABC transporter permease [Thaumarchaeota archaeon]|nr:ribose ABC transporter permease [Nitrososphaerota archaeon]
MSKRRRLGQHFLDDQYTIGKMVELAEISPEDDVLEIGTGEGSLTRELCKKGAKVASFEVDSNLFSKLTSMLHFANLKLFNADALKSNPKFDVLVANLPYSRSEEFVGWLALRKFRRAVVMLQTDFVDKLLATSGRNYRAISIIAQYVFSIRKAMIVTRSLFRPPPKVSSSIVIIQRSGPQPTEEDLHAIKYLWSFKGKTLRSAIKIISKKRVIAAEGILGLLPKRLIALRVSDLSPSEAFKVAEAIEKAS